MSLVCFSFPSWITGMIEENGKLQTTRRNQMSFSIFCHSTERARNSRWSCACAWLQHRRKPRERLGHWNIEIFSGRRFWTTKRLLPILSYLDECQRQVNLPFHEDSVRINQLENGHGENAKIWSSEWPKLQHSVGLPCEKRVNQTTHAAGKNNLLWSIVTGR